ncbi:MAG: DUF1573 domain-containing protein [Flavobacteriales bacterium]
MDQRINTGLLAVVAVLTAVNTVMIGMSANSGESASSKESASQAKEQAKSNITTTKRDRDQKQTAQNKQLQKKKKKKSKPQNPPTTIEFKKYKHDFGKVKAGSKVTKKFKFTNTGDKPYVIQKAKGSCGCTVPKYPKKPIKPGESGEITVNYNPGRKVSGTQNNSVTLTGNTQPRQTKLKIKANVQKAS